MLVHVGNWILRCGAVLLLAAPLNSGSQTAPAVPAQQQEATRADYQSPAVLRATTRLVVVDVVATDSKGLAIPELGMDDFEILEDGKPQKISAFSFHQGTKLNEIRRTASPDVFTNAPRYSGVSSLNVILLDSLNAEYLSRVYGRDQLIKYLVAQPSIQPTAIYALEDRLRLLHDFTTDVKELETTLTNYRPNAPTRVVDVYSASSPFSRRGDFTMNSRTLEATVSALGALAKVLAGYPGRKNLIWVSAAFPLTIYPETYSNTTNPIKTAPGARVAEADPRDVSNQNNNFGSGARSFQDEVERVANAMMNAQVAIYPVDCSGVAQNSRANAAATMRVLAERTGGVTYVNRNDVDAEIRTSMEDGSTYYTIEYYPQNKTWDGRFRAIQVKTTRAETHLRYRQGYYAVSPGEEKTANNERDLARKLSDALSPDMPASTAVLFQAGVVLPSSRTPQVTVNFAVDPHSLAFERKSDGLEHASVSCAVVAYSDKGSPVKKEINSVSAAVKPDEFQKIMQGYFPCKRTIELKPGHYNLTLGVVDQGSGLIGTTTASVTVP